MNPPWKDHPRLAAFKVNVVLGTPDQCWPWRGKAGEYGRFYWPEHGTNAAHRISFQVDADRFIKAGLVIDHLCNNKLCQNPRHMQEVTREENLRRIGERRDACARGHRREEHGYVDRRGQRRCRRCDAMQREPGFEPLRAWKYPQPDLGFEIAQGDDE